MRKQFNYLLFGAALTLLISLLLVLLINSSREEVFPNKEAVNYHYGYYHEDIEENWSTVSLDSSDHGFRMSYILSRATRNPYVAGFIAVNDSDTSLADFHKHNTLRVNLKSNVGMRIPILLTFDYKKGEKKSNGKPFPMVTLEKFVDYYGEGNYDIPLNEMRIPDWWYRVHRLHRDEVDLSKLTNVKGVVIGSCSLLREKARDTIEVKKIEFFTDNTALYWKVGVAVVVFSLMLMVLFLRKAIKVKIRWGDKVV